MIKFAQSTLWFELIFIVFSTFFYLLQCNKKDNADLKKLARLNYFGFTAFTTIASAFLLYFFISHNFKLEYVIQYSSKSLPLHYLISSFWAGQEGSFLLWVFISAWLGVVLIHKSRENESHIMVLYNIQNIFLAILLIKQSPFRETLMNVADGNGLNMLLQDPWMVTHPPIVFLGYAAFAIPFAISMASLWQRKYTEWINTGLPWVAFAFVTLGAGIIIGGVWSYKVLGWGGYWGWDPVENASLLPWLAGIALLHGMILQKAKNQLIKTNYFLAAFSYILIIYSTFLTRSGILADFSVHSFVDLGITGWLVFFIAIFLAISIYLLVSRSKEIPVPDQKKGHGISFFSLEFGLIAAVILLCLSTILTGLGTSAPLITRLAEKASKVSTGFYVTVNLPIAVLIVFFLTYIPLMKWGKNNPVKILPKLIVGIIVALFSAIITLINGFPGIQIFLMALFAGFTIGVNLELLLRLLKKSIAKTSAIVAHLGIGLMFAGFITSSSYDISQRIQLPQGEVKQALGYDLKFSDVKIMDKDKGKQVFLSVEIQKGNKIVTGVPDIYVENNERGESKRFHHPFILRGFLSDLYISPEGFDEGITQKSNNQNFVIKKNETVSYGNYEIMFVNYDLSGMQSQGDHGFSVGADLQVSYKGEKAVSFKPFFFPNVKDNPKSRVKLPGQEDAYLIFVGMNVNDKNISLMYSGPDLTDSDVEEEIPQPIMYAEVSTKPGMTMLWLGVTLLLLGGVFSIYRRKSKN